MIDTGMIVVSTTNPFGAIHQQAARAIRTLVYPAPVLSVYMSRGPDSVSSEADLTFTGPEDFDEAARKVMEALRQAGILAHSTGPKPAFQYSI